MKKRNLKGLLLFFILVCALSMPVQAAAKKLPRLQVKKTKLVDSSGKEVQLRGVSTHGISWFPDYINQKAFTYMKNKWKINAVRLAMYTAEYNGYCTGSEENKKQLEKYIDNGVKYATNAGMYVIIDWHVLNDQDPTKYQKESLAFFKKMAKKYKNNTNVIYEICNEPNGATSWTTVKKYAQKVIAQIRKYDKKAVILVGSPTWSQDVDKAAADPINKKYKNIMYTLHFYAATHGQWLRDRAQKAIDAGLPLFVSEFGICDASGNGSINTSEATKWLNFLDKNKISYMAWSLCNKAETSSLISSGCSKLTGWSNNDLSAAGKWLVKWFKKKR